MRRLGIHVPSQPMSTSRRISSPRVPQVPTRPRRGMDLLQVPLEGTSPWLATRPLTLTTGASDQAACILILHRRLPRRNQLSLTHRCSTKSPSDIARAMQRQEARRLSSRVRDLAVRRLDALLQGHTEHSTRARTPLARFTTKRRDTAVPVQKTEGTERILYLRARVIWTTKQTKRKSKKFRDPVRSSPEQYPKVDSGRTKNSPTSIDMKTRVLELVRNPLPGQTPKTPGQRHIRQTVVSADLDRRPKSWI